MQRIQTGTQNVKSKSVFVNYLVKGKGSVEMYNRLDIATRARPTNSVSLSVSGKEDHEFKSFRSVCGISFST